MAARTERAVLRDVGGFTNRLLLAGIAFEILFASAAVVCLPFLQHVFGTPVPADLLLPLPVPVEKADELRRAWRRRRHGGTSDRHEVAPRRRETVLVLG